MQGEWEGACLLATGRAPSLAARRQTIRYLMEHRTLYMERIPFMTRVLLIEDDPAVRRGVVLGLRRHGHETEAVGTGEDGLEALNVFKPDLVLLDLMLPGMNGLEVCRRIRETSQLPIVILSARDDDMDIVVGLEVGADDYVVKPASSALIEARMRAVLRRVAPSQADADLSDGANEVGALEIDRGALSVRKHGEDLPLAPPN